ncbi:membrane dipeptidase [Phaffia rhodozyma]|uniref:Dipeptidase n=1 Tax=Phaffia rhodozyma TaxID=264483 RepID=A0A0F7SWB4_PHARH|nr:membrane dipeptidase [Phaffia rhodozyma]
MTSRAQPDTEPLLPPARGAAAPSPRRITRASIYVLVVAFILLFAAAITLILTGKASPPFWKDEGPSDPLERAHWLLSRTKTPIIDGHIDLPEYVRTTYSNNVSEVHLDKKMGGHVDIKRLRKGHVGGFFWSCYTDCPEEPLLGKGQFLDPTNSVRDTLEQIDVSKVLIAKYNTTFELAKSADDLINARKNGKIASFLGIEGAHQLGNSLAVLRMYAELGVKYMTLTHSCNNAFADSAGIFDQPTPVHGGLSELGRELIVEMNRLGVIVDLSHVSDQTAEQALDLTRAPVIWSHSSSRKFVDIQRNVPDAILRKIGYGKGLVDGVVHVNFAPYFIVNKGQPATAEVVADHIEHIRSVIGWKHVGLGSDFDGIEIVPKNLESVADYPKLFAILIRRGWKDEELEALAGGNTLRILREVESVKRQMEEEHVGASMGRYLKRDDL